MQTAGRDRIRVAAVQAHASPGDVAGNAAAAAGWVARAATDGADVVVLPELFLSAYHPPTLVAQPSVDLCADEAGAISDARLDPLRAAARDHRAVVVVGSPVRHTDGRRTCSAVVVDRAGEATAAYDKQMLWGTPERALFSPGTRGATITVDGWRFGLGICNDGCFPEHARSAALSGAYGYLAPSAYVTGSAHRRDVYYAARALDNLMYVVFANAVGGTEPYEFNGGSAIYEPEGRPMCRAPERGEHVIVAELDHSEVDRAREFHGLLAECRRDLGERFELAVH
jgi:predicted amidohydrolase